MEHSQHSKLKSGDKFLDYRLLQCCGSGAYGEVYLAEDMVGKRVALKIVAIPLVGNAYKRELDGLRNYRNAIKDHPNLLQIYHIGEAPGCFYYTMESADNIADNVGGYVPDTLENRLKRRERFSAEETIELSLMLLSGLSAMHKVGLAHRDIKPANIIFAGGKPKLSDIGLVSSFNADASIVGTLGFIPPESVSGKSPVCSQGDLYAMGRLIYCAFTGESVENFPVPASDMPLAEYSVMRPILLKACHRDVKSRFQSAAELSSALLLAKKTLLSKSGKTVWKRKPLIWTAFIVLIVMTFACYAILTHRLSPEPLPANEVSKLLKMERDASYDELLMQIQPPPEMSFERALYFYVHRDQLEICRRTNALKNNVVQLEKEIKKLEKSDSPAREIVLRDYQRELVEAKSKLDQFISTKPAAALELSEMELSTATGAFLMPLYQGQARLHWDDVDKEKELDYWQKDLTPKYIKMLALARLHLDLLRKTSKLIPVDLQKSVVEIETKLQPLEQRRLDDDNAALTAGEEKIRASLVKERGSLLREIDAIFSVPAK